MEIFETGVDTDFHRVLTALDPGAELESLTPCAQVRVRVVANNAAGDGAPSDEVTVAVPALAAA